LAGCLLPAVQLLYSHAVILVCIQLQYGFYKMFECSDDSNDDGDSAKDGHGKSPEE
jgi:hypothetical protein